ncbi:sugar phosphate isomerase/epimerase family protein [Aurantimonas sp. A2-1-M11]|uniref:sugar phosphate isomerase/epimerase family protein n=1 Tax=Aurantimonas sp. A2-1-M11 TaxID=3113712 RepID=UPI002F952BC6
MSVRTVSVSAAPYDGHPLPLVLDSLAACGATHVEPAFIVGYTEPFDETAFAPAEADRYRRAIEASGLGCRVMSSHIDLGNTDAVDVFAGRMGFARDIGASIILTNAARRANSATFEANIAALLPLAEERDLIIALENPGDGSDNLFNLAADGVALVERFASPRLRLNYDAANTASHRPTVDATADAIAALPASAHMHLKDVRRTAEGWFFQPLGRGDIDMPRLFAALARHRHLPVSLELPLRLHRGPDARPVRQAAPVALEAIERAVTTSMALIHESLPVFAVR